MTIYENMALAVKRFKRGSYTIDECERVLDDLIAEATPDYSDYDRRLSVQKKLKRKKWRMLLDATK